jgi:hypothetical protein
MVIVDRFFSDVVFADGKVAVGQALDTEAHVLFEGTLLEVFLR